MPSILHRSPAGRGGLAADARSPVRRSDGLECARKRGRGSSRLGGALQRRGRGELDPKDRLVAKRAALSSWDGVTTDGNGRVTELRLVQNRLNGRIPAQLGNLAKLERLAFSSNRLSGAIPTQLGNLTALQWLSLGNNQLSGAIPAQLGDLTALRSLGLGNNKLSGAIPAHLGQLVGLESLGLQSNHLTGEIPAEFQNLANLYGLYIGDSGVTGVLPDWLRNLPRLASLVWRGADVCAPRDAAFQAWLETLYYSDGFTCPADGPSVIDLAVFYTPASRDYLGGTDQIRTEIDLWVAATNQAYADSGVNQQLSLVTSEEVDYEERPGNNVVKIDFYRSSDGHMDGVHDVIDSLGADIAVLVASHRVLLVTGSAMSAKVYPDLAFAVVSDRAGEIVFAHELGHVMGLSHDRYSHCNSGTCEQIGEFPYGYGYPNRRAFFRDSEESRRWMTIMGAGYTHECTIVGGIGCTTMLRFSNPDLTYLGDPTGVSGVYKTDSVEGPANAARALNRTRETVSNFRSRPASTDPPAITVSLDPAQITVPEGASATVTVRLSADPERSVAIPLTATHEGGALSGDYSGVPASLLFLTGETEYSFEFSAEDDLEDDDGEVVVLGIGSDLPEGVSAGTTVRARVAIPGQRPDPWRTRVDYWGVLRSPGRPDGGCDTDRDGHGYRSLPIDLVHSRWVGRRHRRSLVRVERRWPAGVPCCQGLRGARRCRPERDVRGDGSGHGRPDTRDCGGSGSVAQPQRGTSSGRGPGPRERGRGSDRDLGRQRHGSGRGRHAGNAGIPVAADRHRTAPGGFVESDRGQRHVHRADRTDRGRGTAIRADGDRRRKPGG